MLLVLAVLAVCTWSVFVPEWACTMRSLCCCCCWDGGGGCGGRRAPRREARGRPHASKGAVSGRTKARSAETEYVAEVEEEEEGEDKEGAGFAGADGGMLLEGADDGRRLEGFYVDTRNGVAPYIRRPKEAS